MSNSDIINALYDSFASGNIPAVLGAMDENISWTEAEGFPHGELMSGRTPSWKMCL